MNQFQFLGPAYESRSPNYSSQRMVNLFLEKGQGKNPWVMHGTPGLTAPAVTLTGSVGYSGVRGVLKQSDNYSLWVCGSTPQFVYPDSSGTSLLASTIGGTIAYDRNPVTMAYDGINILICSAGYLYSVYSPSGGGSYGVPALITTNVGSVDFLDGYFIYNQEGTGRFFVSNQYSTTFDPLDFATAEGAPDNLVRVLVHNREAILFGKETTEFWYVSGNADFPMSRVQGAYIEEGLAARYSAVKCGATVAWLGSSKNGAHTVWMLNGYTPVPISTNAISYAISRWATTEDATAFFYRQEDHAFYVLTSPSSNETWAYDFSTGQWHERAWLDDSGNLKRIRPNVYSYAHGRHLVGDWENGYVYEYDLDTYSDNSQPIKRIRSCNTLQKDLKFQRNKKLRLDMETGVGTGSDTPQAVLRYSRDGGRTWSDELWRSIGAIGEYGRRVIWNRVGGGERSVYEFSITDPVKVAITGAYLE